MTVSAISNPILTGAGVLDPKNGAIETTGAIRIIPKKNNANAEIGAKCVSLEKNER